MKRTLTAGAALAALVAFAAPATQAMEQELTMLERTVAANFEDLGVEGVDMAALTLGQLAQIKTVLESEENVNQKRNQVEAIIAQ